MSEIFIQGDLEANPECKSCERLTMITRNLNHAVAELYKVSKEMDTRQAKFENVVWRVDYKMCLILSVFGFLGSVLGSILLSLVQKFISD